MFLSPYADKENIVILVVGEDHNRYGQLARIDPFKKLDYRVYRALYADGEKDILSKDRSIIEDFYRIDNVMGIMCDAQGAGPKALVKRFQQETGKSLERLEEEYHELFRGEFLWIRQ